MYWECTDSEETDGVENYILGGWTKVKMRESELSEKVSEIHEPRVYPCIVFTSLSWVKWVCIMQACDSVLYCIF